MAKKLTFKEASDRIKNKYPYLILLSFNGFKKISRFYDLDFGGFSNIYSFVVCGGVKHSARTKIIKANSYTEERKIKTAKTNEIRFGGKSPMCSKQVKEKSKQTLIKNYGVENPIQSGLIREKIKETTFKNLGVEHNSQSQKIKDKKCETNFQKLGVKTPFESEIVKVKSKLTNLKNLGVENPSQSFEIKNKKKQLMFENGTYNCIDGYSALEYFKINNIYGKYGTFIFYLNNFGLDCAFKYLTTKQYNKNISTISNKWLSIIETNNKSLIKEYHISNTLYHSDAYDPGTNTVYEFYGDYWHGYPFKDCGINKVVSQSFNTLYYKTIERENKILELGYNLVTIWESDFKQQLKNK